MTTYQIANLLTPFLESQTLSDRQCQLIATYLELLLKWNSKFNLTSIREPVQIVTRHFGESLFAARHLIPDQHSRLSVIDVGSGTGFPGLVLKIWAPEISLTLIESSQKKSVFLREVARTLKFSDASVLTERAQQVTSNAELVTLRAVEKFEAVIPIAGGLVTSGGKLGLLIGSSQADTAKSALPGFGWDDPISIPLSQQRILLIGSSTRPIG